MRNRRSLVCVLLAALLSLAFVFPGCSSDNGGDENVLKVGMECGYQPYNWTQLTDEDGAVPIQGRKGQYANGYDVKIAKRIAEGLGKTLQIYAYEWDSLIPAVQSGALDLIIAGMSPTDERKEKVDFSEPKFTTGRENSPTEPMQPPDDAALCVSEEEAGSSEFDSGAYSLISNSTIRSALPEYSPMYFTTTLAVPTALLSAYSR